MVAYSKLQVYIVIKFIKYINKTCAPAYFLTINFKHYYIALEQSGETAIQIPKYGSNHRPIGNYTSPTAPVNNLLDFTI